MPKLQFLNTDRKSLLSGVNFYLWDASALPTSKQFPSKAAPTPLTCGKLDTQGNLQPFEGIQFDLPAVEPLPEVDVSVPTCKAGPVRIGSSGLQAGLLRTFFQLSQQDLQAVTTDDVEQIALSSVNPQLINPMPPTPIINLRFFVLSNIVLSEGMSVLRSIFTWVGFLQHLWTPPNTGPMAKYLVTFQWDRTYKQVDDSANSYKRIDFTKSGSPQALNLIKANWNNPHFNPDIPIFVCNAAWNWLYDPDPPHDGRESGHTLNRLEPGFKGDGAILLFVHSPGPDTLAHEMTHWVGFSHPDSEALGKDNIGRTGGGGTEVAPQQFASLYKWATIRGFRRSISFRP